MSGIEKAEKALGSWYLDGCVLYTTLEPCLMCAGAIFQSRIRRVVYAAKEPKFGSFGSILDLSKDEYKFNHKVAVTSGILEDEAASLLKSFFKEIRNKIEKDVRRIFSGTIFETLPNLFSKISHLACFHFS